jgi:hypothetical protein
MNSKNFYNPYLTMDSSILYFENVYYYALEKYQAKVIYFNNLDFNISLLRNLG